MATFARLHHAKISPQKARLVIDQVRGLSVVDALNILTFSPKKAAHLIKKVVESAMANAEHNLEQSIDDLVISEAYVKEAMTAKRFRARARGRADRIFKRSCHIVVGVDLVEEGDG